MDPPFLIEMDGFRAFSDVTPLPDQINPGRKPSYFGRALPISNMATNSK
jgi:hypothetical protein